MINGCDDVVVLSKVATSRNQEQADQCVGELLEDCRTVAESLGSDVSGYAVVIWGKNGELRSAYNTGRGPIRPALVPTLVSDALNRHVTLEMGQPVRREQ